MAVKTYDTFNGMSLYLQHDNGTSQMNFGLVDKRPRISIFLKDNPAQKFKLINIKLTYVAVATLFAMIKEATTMDAPSLQFDSFDTVFTDDGQRTDDTALIGSMLIHRDDRGILTLAVKVPDGKVYPFKVLLNGKYHKAKSGDKPITETKTLSNITTRVFADMLIHMYAQSALDNRYTVER